jgi:hypothetical protein
MITTTNSQTPIEQLLPATIILRLSPEGRRLYAALYSSMEFKQVNRIELSDDVVSRRSRVPMQQLESAKDELGREQLMDAIPVGDRVCYVWRDFNES